MLNAIIIAALAASTIDLDAGTVMCRSESAATEYLQAIDHHDESRLSWLHGTACYALPRSFGGQKVLARGERMLVVEWSNGRFRKVRYVVQGV